MSIVGSGDIASVLKGKWYEPSIKFIFFTSGVSDSSCSDYKEFDREDKLLLSQPKNKHLVYFSTLSIEYKTSPYTIHKQNMEDTVINHFKSYTIIRIGNITWGNNPKTLLNFIRNKIINNEPFEVQDVYRNLISKQDLLDELNNITLGEKRLVNLLGKKMKVKEIVDMLKKELDV